MGQTLNHGVYLPAEGERNCYSGLASNWNLLDTAIGDIAGKASATHTHGDISNDGKVGTTANKPLITGTGGVVQAGSFGNQANTFCEGNDSRLSDARTPVAHTHGKADVTDLFNSANTWSDSQTYSKTVISNAAEVLHCKNTNVALGETPASDYQKLFMFKDKNNDNFGYYRHLYQTTGSSQFDILVRNKFTNGAPDTSGSIDYLSFSLRLSADKSKEGVLMGSFKPSNTNTYDLGSSSYQWNNLYAKKVNTQSVNGINPGALSIFNPSATQDPIDVPNTWITDGSAWNTLNVSNMGDGWICLTYLACGTNDYILARFGGTNAGTYPSMIFPATRLADSGYFVYALMPVAKAMINIYLEIKLDSNAVLIKHSFIPAYGTV